MSPSLNLFTLLRRSSDDDSNDCQMPLDRGDGKELSIGITMRMLFFWISLACLVITLVSGLILTWSHLHRYTVPKEQKHLVRIIALPSIFCIVSVLSVFFVEDSIYLNPIMKVYEAFCVAGLFMLFTEYVHPDESTRNAFFEDTPLKDKKGNLIPGGSLNWYKRTFAKVLQFPLCRLLQAVVEIATQAAGVYCQNSFSTHYAHLWVTIIDVFSSSAALTGLIIFWKKFKGQMDPKNKATAKLITLKGLVILRVLQVLVLGIVSEHFDPTPTFTFNDFVFAFPNLLVAIESVIFAAAYFYAFSSKEYSPANRPGAEPRGVFYGALSSLNITDVIVGTAIAIVRLWNGKHRQPKTEQLPHHYSADSSDDNLKQEQGVHMPPPAYPQSYSPSYSPSYPQPYHERY